MSKIYIKKVICDNKKQLSNHAWNTLKDILIKDYNVYFNNEDILYKQHKKPYIKNNPIFFNISHSNNYIAIIISNNCEVGIDIELIKNIKNKIKFNEMLNQNYDDEKQIIMQFSKLEAHYKKIGTGIYPNKLKNDVNITFQQIIKDDNNEYVLSVDCDDTIEKTIHI